MSAIDGFRLEEWNALPEVCLIAGCDSYEIDHRGPVWLRDGSMHKACTDHWEPIHRVLGEQATWEHDHHRLEGRAMSEITTYTEQNSGQIADLLIGRRIVQAEKGEFDYPGRDRWDERPEGRLVLDDGTVLYLAGHDGGCGCNAGCYPLDKVATVDNVITSARVEADPHTDEEPWFGEGARDHGAYRIFVIADAVEINVAEFVGTDGNGYYGTGFSLTVVRPESDR